ncbi:MAG: adenosylmethionine--8-amino-7-oxononanoate transaminase [Verrucomicrobia bacterium]|nr:adenosylmethionine--8-amino-7-oxononanoate transaminase [Verrucomicrobiota bacterium]
MREWMQQEPIILVSGQGCWLTDSKGRCYLDGNSSIWTNVHGHNHPRLNDAVRQQLERIAHTSFLGFTNPPAIELASKLVQLLPRHTLRKVFFSDNGSTAVEAAIKMTIQFFQQNGQPEKTGFIAFENAYHGDTLGASSLSGISTFHERFKNHHFSVTRVGSMQQLDSLNPCRIGGLIIEPMIQGAAGMRVWPQGMLKGLREWCDTYNVLLIFDEVMTAFGRTGKMFALEGEGIIPDLLALAKGLTGGYMPLAATLTTDRVFEAFLGSYKELRTFFYGHSYAGNQLGCAVSIANLDVFEEEETLLNLQPKISFFTDRLKDLAQQRFVREIRRCGFIAGIEIGDTDGSPFDWQRQMGSKVCHAARKHGILTRSIRDVIVLMLPLCVQKDEIALGISAISQAIDETCGT